MCIRDRNAVVGDHLHHSANPLAIPMGCYVRGHPIPLTTEGLAANLSSLSDQLCLFIHGLGCDCLLYTSRCV